MNLIETKLLIECIQMLIIETEDLKAEVEALKKIKTLEDPSGCCCESMKAQFTYECDQHPGLSCPDIIITKSDTFPLVTNDNSIVDIKVSPYYILRGRNADYHCQFCPWCGTNLGYQAYRKDVEALFEGE